MPIRTTLLLLAVLCLAFAPAPFPRSRKGPPKPPGDLLGRWVQLDLPTRTVVIAADSMTYYNAGSSTVPYHLTIDSTKSPKTYDLTHKITKSKFAGIWKVEGDILTLHSNNGTTRPTEFVKGKAREYRRLANEPVPK